MASLLAQILQNLGERMDEDLLPGLYAATRVRPDILRAELDKDGLARHDPQAGLLPEPAELEAAARTLIERAARSATMRGAVAGIAGLLAMPPEAVAGLIGAMRLAQRLAVVYGFDPETDRGKILITRAIAAAFELELPEQARVDFRLTQLPAVVGRQLPDRQRATRWMVQRSTSQVARALATRLTRAIPGAGMGIAAWSARRRLREQGARMQLVFSRAWDGSTLYSGDFEEAVEVRPADRD